MFRRRIVIVAAFVVAAVAALAIRVVGEGRAALARGNAASLECYRTWDARVANPPPRDFRPCLAAIDAYETAARWYLPLAPHVDEAYDKLRIMAITHEPKRGSVRDAGDDTADLATALAAWRAIRSAARATRSLSTPHRDDLAAADAAIARLSASDPAAGKLSDAVAGKSSEQNTESARGSATRSSTATGLGSATAPGSSTSTGSSTATGPSTLTGTGSATGSATTSVASTSGTASAPTTNGGAATAGGGTPDDMVAREAWHRGRLARDVRPSVGAAATAGVGVLLWLVGVVVLVRRGLDRAGVWVRRPAMAAGAAIVLGVVLWLVGLANA